MNARLGVHNQVNLDPATLGSKAPNGPGSSFAIAARLMNDAFIHYRNLIAVKKGATVGQVPVTDGQAKTVPAAAAADVDALVRRGDEGTVKTSLAPNSVTAPVRAGQQVGWVVVTQNGKQITKVPAVAAANVEKQPWWKKFWPF